jgi:hypothetical protein
VELSFPGVIWVLVAGLWVVPKLADHLGASNQSVSRGVFASFTGSMTTSHFTLVDNLALVLTGSGGLSLVKYKKMIQLFKLALLSV